MITKEFYLNQGVNAIVSPTPTALVALGSGWSSLAQDATSSAILATQVASGSYSLTYTIATPTYSTLAYEYTIPITGSITPTVGFDIYAFALYNTTTNVVIAVMPVSPVVTLVASQASTFSMNIYIS